MLFCTNVPSAVRPLSCLECWQEARTFVRVVYELTKRDTFRKDFGLVDKVRRSAVSSMANISEGFHRASDKDFLRFLD